MAPIARMRFLLLLCGLATIGLLFSSNADARALSAKEIDALTTRALLEFDTPGAAVAVVAFALTGEKPFANMTRLAMLGIAGALALMATPIGADIIDMLPFIGDTSANSIEKP